MYANGHLYGTLQEPHEGANQHRELSTFALCFQDYLLFQNENSPISVCIIMVFKFSCFRHYCMHLPNSVSRALSIALVLYCMLYCIPRQTNNLAADHELHSNRSLQWYFRNDAHVHVYMHAHYLLTDCYECYVKSGILGNADWLCCSQTIQKCSVVSLDVEVNFVVKQISGASLWQWTSMLHFQRGDNRWLTSYISHLVKLWILR